MFKEDINARNISKKTEKFSKSIIKTGKNPKELKNCKKRTNSQKI